MTTMAYTDVQQQQRLDDWFPGLRADMDRLRAGNAELRAALAAAELSLQLIAADNRDLEDAHRRIAELEAERAAVPLEAIAACLRCIGHHAPNALGTYSPRTVAAWLEARGVQDSLLELAAANKRAEAAEATSYDIAAQAALEAQNLREALTAERQRAEAAKAQADAMRADIDILCGLLESVLDGMTVQELAALGDALDAVRERWGLGEGRGA